MGKHPTVCLGCGRKFNYSLHMEDFCSQRCAGRRIRMNCVCEHPSVLHEDDEVRCLKCAREVVPA